MTMTARKPATKAKSANKTKALPPRSKVKPADTWDLASLYPDDAAWEKAFAAWSKQVGGYAKFKGHLGESAAVLAECLAFDEKFERTSERLGTYASLKTTEDQANSDYQRMQGRYEHVATQAAEASSYIRPEIIQIDEGRMSAFLKEKVLAGWTIALERLLRYRPHTLGQKEEHLLAMQGQMSQAAPQAFRQLNDADLKWGTIRDEKGQLVELGHSSFSAFLHSPSRAVRREAFHKYYAQYDAHKNTISATLAGSVQRDVYYAKARNYPARWSRRYFTTACRSRCMTI